MNLFDLESTPFRFSKNKKIRIFTTFSGIGCQEMALSRITKNFEVLGFAEIDNSAIKSYLAIHGNIKNYGDICKIRGIDLPNGIDIFTYSFPCTDLSKAGKQKGLNSGTRSGLVFEVLRLLKELKEEKNLPKVLIMENVPDLLSPKFKSGWHTIYNEIEAMGYENYVSILNAKDYGIPQNRNRVFMVSVPKGYYYEFPDKAKLVIKLKDLLEDEVDKKYYLSEKMLRFLNDETNRNGFIRKKQYKIDESDIAFTITTKAGCRPTDNFIEVFDLSGQPFIKVPQATKQGYAIAEIGDGIYTNRTESKRGVVQKESVPTLKTSPNDLAVVVDDNRNLKEKLCDELINSGILKGGEIINHSYTNKSKKENSRLSPEDYIESTNGIMPTLHTRGDIFGVVGEDKTGKIPKLRIRKLTPLECWRLMGILDEDFHKAKNAGVSNSQLFKQAGNGIVVNVMEAILKQLF